MSPFVNIVFHSLVFNLIVICVIYSDCHSLSLNLHYFTVNSRFLEPILQIEEHNSLFQSELVLKLSEFPFQSKF